ncbi:MAG: hypothetical protein LBJ23_07370, partial [Tannerella sp.]|nr:hypothetical protein [Tannerella sp.]
RFLVNSFFEVLLNVLPEQGDVHSIKPPANPVIANAVKQSNRHDVWIASFLAMTKIRFFPSAITAMFHPVSTCPYFKKEIAPQKKN